MEAIMIGNFIVKAKYEQLGYVCHPGKRCRASSSHAAPAVATAQETKVSLLNHQVYVFLKGECDFFTNVKVILFTLTVIQLQPWGQGGDLYFADSFMQHLLHQRLHACWDIHRF